MKPIVIKRDGSQVSFNALRIAEAILKASGVIRYQSLTGAKCFGSPVCVYSRKVAVTFLAFVVINLLLKITFDRRQVFNWVNSVFIAKLYVDRPNNKSPPVLDN